MSWALTALLLIRLDARAGQLVAVRDLAEHIGEIDAVVRRELEQLAAGRQLEVARDTAGTITHARTRTSSGAPCA